MIRRTPSIALTAQIAFWAAVWAALPARAQDKDRDLRLHLDYTGRFSVFGKVLDAKVDERVDGGAFEADARLHSAGLLAILKQIEERATSRGRIVDGRARPGVFRYDNPGARKYRKVEIDWTDTAVTTVSSVPILFWGDPPASPAQKLEAADPLTQVMRMTLPARGPDCRGSARFFDGKALYDLDFLDREAAARTGREKRLGLVDPVRCHVRFREVAGFKKKPAEQRNQGLKTPVALTFARLGASGPWLISAIETETNWGGASVELEEITTPKRD